MVTKGYNGCMSNPTITPTYQTFTGTGDNGNTPGNCLVASIATITGIALETIPHFVDEYLTEADRLAANISVDAMNDLDWLEVLANAQAWLNTQGFDSAPCERLEPTADLFGGPVYPCLALVMAGGTVPHIIVTDQRGMQMWDPNPTTAEPYTPSDVLAMLAVIKR